MVVKLVSITKCIQLGNKNMKKQLLLCGVAASLALAAIPAMSDDHMPSKATSEKQANTQVTFRKSALQLLRANMGPLGAMAKGNIPMDADVIATNAERIEMLGMMLHEYFSLDTSAYSKDTGAKDDIWKNYADFSAKNDDLVTAAGNLVELVANGEESDYRKGIGALGATCKACHDEYKKD